MVLTQKIVDDFRSRRILVIGDVMLDHFIWGAVRRISPEAPVPIVEVTSENYYPGGAANVARNLAPFIANPLITGRIGQDEAADKLCQILTEEGVTNCFVRSAEVATIAKMRIIARQQQVVRVDREQVVSLNDAELAQVEQLLQKELPVLDAVIIEDYAKGFVTQKLVGLVTRLANAAGVIVTADPSPRNQLNWNGLTIVKPNRIEAFSAVGMTDSHLDIAPLENAQLLQVGRLLLEKWGVPTVLITLGELGMLVFSRGGPPVHLPTRAREVYDVSGAGDTAIALLTVALASGLPVREAAEIANHASGIVVSKLGTASITPAELLASFED